MISRPCVDCQLVKPTKARGLCKPCYERNRNHGTLEQYPRIGWPEAKDARPCARCDERRHIHARGLCYRCHNSLSQAGQLNTFRRLTWARDELLAEWDHLRRAGVGMDEAARRLGISRDGLKKAIERAGKRAA